MKRSSQTSHSLNTRRQSVYLGGGVGRFSHGVVTTHQVERNDYSLYARALTSTSRWTRSNYWHKILCGYYAALSKIILKARLKRKNKRNGTRHIAKMCDFFCTFVLLFELDIRFNSLIMKW